MATSTLKPDLPRFVSTLYPRSLSSVAIISANGLELSNVVVLQVDSVPLSAYSKDLFNPYTPSALVRFKSICSASKEENTTIS